MQWNFIKELICQDYKNFHYALSQLFLCLVIQDINNLINHNGFLESIH